MSAIADAVLAEAATRQSAAELERGARGRLRDLYAPIADDLAAVERLLHDTLASDSDFIAELVKRVQLYGGKRLRPALHLLSARACGEVDEDHYAVAATVELIHVATLVHDDVLDEADKRRHVTTVNAEWGTEPSLLLGDFLFTHAFQLAAGTDSIDACRWLGKSTNLMCAGELHQVSRRGQFELSEAEYLDMLGGKTAELIAAACGLAARYSGAPKEWEDALTSFGRDLGIAFQIADDVLDLLGTEAITGKTVGSDLKKQKMTLPLIRFRDAAPPNKVAELHRCFENPGPTQTKVAAELISESDALDYTRDRGFQFVEAAVRDLEVLPPSVARDSLMGIARFAMDRNT